MITIENYYQQISSIDFSKLPEVVQKGRDYVEKVTYHGMDWSSYHSSEAIKKVIDIYLEKLNELTLAPAKPPSGNGKQPKPAKQPTPKKERPQKQPTPKAAAEPTQPATLVERIPEEIRFIKRFVNLNGKTKTKDDILRFLNALQKSILEKRIRKTSPYAEQVLFIQDKLVTVHNTMGRSIKIELKPDTVERFAELAKSEKVMPSINFIKRYISLNGKAGTKEKAKQLLAQINRALDKGKIADNDPYTTEIHALKKHLNAYIFNKSAKTLEIEKTELNGLQGLLGCSCQQYHGLDGAPEVMNSMDFANLQFNTIGLRGKWFDLIGDPSSNFTAMVFGKPKMGKSYLCIEFAGHLARHHGKVLYVAREEGLDLTLQNKLNETDVKHPNLYMAAVLPEQLSDYDFIFLDSVTKLNLSPADLSQLRRTHPTKSFIFIFQTTKAGAFRGANSFQHDVDIVIEVPDKGRAVQMGRFNQGGEMAIFD